MEPVERFDLTARLDDNPRYRGSSHDDETARAMGFRAALIPGAFLYGHVTRLAVRAWGMDWLERGWAQVRFRRPVYNGDRLSVERAAFAERNGRLEAEVAILSGPERESVVTGHIGLPDARPEPPTDLPITPPPTTPLDANPDVVIAGHPFGSRPRVLDRESIRKSLTDFDETEGIYERETRAHSGLLVRQTMGDTLSSIRFPVPVVFVSVEVQNYTSVPAGATIATSARIAAAYERKGRPYFDSEEYLIADGCPAARHLRVNLYG